LRSFYNRPGLLLSLTSAFWAGNFVLGRAVVGFVPPVTLACLRWTLASLLFLPFAWPHLRKDAAQIARSWPIILFLGVFGAACYNTFSYVGLLSTEALNGLVLNAAGPMFIALAAWSLFGDPLETSQLIGMAIGFSGVLFIVAKGDLASLATLRFNPGDVLIILAITTWSIYTAFLRKRPHISWQSLSFSLYVVAALCNFPFALVERGLGQTMVANWATAACVVYVAIFPSLIAYIFYNRGVELLGPIRAGLYLFLVPVFGAVLAMVFLGEKLYLFHALGFALILVGVLIGSRGAVPTNPAVACRPRE
jgi:drug/metabolite transporter (DMT)-like permease